jgi:hypothetical protein
MISQSNIVVESQPKLSMHRAAIWRVAVLTSLLANALLASAIGSMSFWNSIDIGPLWSGLHVDQAAFETGFIVIAATMTVLLAWAQWRSRLAPRIILVPNAHIPAKKARLAAGVNGGSRNCANGKKATEAM